MATLNKNIYVRDILDGQLIMDTEVVLWVRGNKEIFVTQKFKN